MATGYYIADDPLEAKAEMPGILSFRPNLLQIRGPQHPAFTWAPLVIRVVVPKGP